MATTKNITMKQFNGTDYDTLYPKTDVKQVENLTPSSIGAVAKTGDTMTGNLNITNSNPYLKLVETDSQEEYLVQVHQGDFYIGSQSHGPINGLVLKPDGTILAKALYTVLHTGNAQSLGFPKIATGSYVGTGNCGVRNPTTVTVGFIPKFFWICLELDDRDGELIAYTIPGGGAGENNSLFINPFTKYYCSQGSTSRYYVTVTWGSTMSWYGYVDFDDTEHGKYQFNKAGVTYYWVAIG